jgi:hypothetical protein
MKSLSFLIHSFSKCKIIMPKQFFFKKIIFFFEGLQLRNKSIILVFIFLRIRHFPDLHWKQIVAIDQWLKRLFLLNLLRRSLFYLIWNDETQGLFQALSKKIKERKGKSCGEWNCRRLKMIWSWRWRWLVTIILG